MRTHIKPVRSEDQRADGEGSIEARKAAIRGENHAWHIGRTGRDDNDPMAGISGGQVDLTRVMRGRRFRR